MHLKNAQNGEKVESVMKNHICLSQMTAKKGKAKELEKALLALIEDTLKEPGCIAYELWKDLENPESFVMYERFASKQALDAHLESPYVQTFIKREYMRCVESHWDMDFTKVGG